MENAPNRRGQRNATKASKLHESKNNKQIEQNRPDISKTRTKLCVVKLKRIKMPTLARAVDAPQEEQHQKQKISTAPLQAQRSNSSGTSKAQTSISTRMNTRRNGQATERKQNSSPARKQTTDDHLLGIVSNTTNKIKKCVVKVQRSKKSPLEGESEQKSKRVLNEVADKQNNAGVMVQDAAPLKEKNAEAENNKCKGIKIRVRRTEVGAKTPQALKKSNEVAQAKRKRETDDNKENTAPRSGINLKKTTDNGGVPTPTVAGMQTRRRAQLITHSEAPAANVKNFETSKSVSTRRRPAFNQLPQSQTSDMRSEDAIEKQTVARIPIKNVEQDQKKAINKSPSPLAQNLANKTDMIEQLLFEEEEVIIVPSSTQKASAIISTDKPHKFFHRLPPELSDKCNFKKPTVPRKRKTVVRSSGARCSASEGNVYDFLSLSQTSDSDNAKHKDPAADIIQRLIKEGKVRVATARKGTGRPVIKRTHKNAVQRKAIQLKRAALRPKSTRKANNAPAINKAPTVEVNGFDDDFEAPPEATPPDNPVEAVGPMEENNNNSKNQANNNTFSRLARSVLLQETDKSNRARRSLVANQQRLLEMAKKFVSTPVNNKRNLNTLQNTDLSPIPPPKPPQFANTSVIKAPASPWRVPDEVHLPSVFHFSKNSSHLPSFSSDFIPPTPKKRVQFVVSPNNTSSVAEFEYGAQADGASTSAAAAAAVSAEPHTFPPLNDDMPSTSAAALAALRQRSSVAAEMSRTSAPVETNLSRQTSSFSSNDSNAENMPPPTTVHLETADENADVFNLRQQPNPRRTYGRRSPLKAINILEVVVLPSWKDATADKTAFVEKSHEIANDEATASVDNLFGFDEFIDDEEESGEVDNQSSKVNESSSKHVNSNNFRKKLRRLRKWRPSDVNGELCDKPENAKPIANVFDENAGRLRQRHLKEMFCSTMVKQPQQHQQQQNAHVVDSDEDDSEAEKDRDAEVGLFNDPENTFNATKPLYTYGRQIQKKKRKVRHNFVMFVESDDSEEEDSFEDHHAKPLKKHRKEKAKPKEKINPELETFVEEFNSMCKEVDQYNLIVE